MIKKLLLRQKNFSRLGKIKVAIGLAVLLLPTDATALITNGNYLLKKQVNIPSPSMFLIKP
jgi:hypothetical protein